MPPRRRGKSLLLDLPGQVAEDKPPLAALFLIQFDVKAGYTIAWKRSIPQVDVSDSVEFKSLPSGLHNVEEDLVYFMHGDDYAGISAFVNKSTEQAERNAVMLAVGALVPLEQGRLGRSWKHAAELKELARKLLEHPKDTEVLEKYWEEHQAPKEPLEQIADESEGASDHGSQMNDSTSSVRRRRSRMKSMGSIYGGSLSLSAYHPALSMPSLVSNFGPLIYPLYKAALLRKRILLLSSAPVELACNYVYDISIISNIPSTVADLIPLEPLPNRLQPLFSVGVHDIDDLTLRNRPSSTDLLSSELQELGYGWIACTTDDVLSMKKNLYDVIVQMPPEYSVNASEKSWPTVATSEGELLKASQRDLRRYRSLRQSMKQSGIPLSGSVLSRPVSSNGEPDGSRDNEDDTAPLIHQNTNETFDDASSTTDEKLVEPLSWSALAYNSFIWWASAGEARADLDDEIEHDSAMFRDFASYVDTPGGTRTRRLSASLLHPLTPGAAMTSEMSSGVPEMAIIAYFHRLTASIFKVLAEVVDAETAREDARLAAEEPAGQRYGQQQQQQASASEDGGASGAATPPPAFDAVEETLQKPPLFVSSEDMVRMGLDLWSDGDRKFIEELLELYWGRTADVQGRKIECCGIRIL